MHKIRDPASKTTVHRYLTTRRRAEINIPWFDSAKFVFFVVSLCNLQLQVLDLSENMIEDVDTQELPHALVIVNMAGNPCCREPSFRQRITCTLPDLKVS